MTNELGSLTMAAPIINVRFGLLTEFTYMAIEHCARDATWLMS
jgi:hypothetical protein